MTRRKRFFEEVLKADSTCAIRAVGNSAYVSQQSAHRNSISQSAPGLAAIQQAKAMNAKTERERDYIDALALMYVDHDKLTHRERISAFRKRWKRWQPNIRTMMKLRIAYAITLNASASPSDKTHAQQARGVGLPEPISKRLPAAPERDPLSRFTCTTIRKPRIRGLKPPSVTQKLRLPPSCATHAFAYLHPASAIGRNR